MVNFSIPADESDNFTFFSISRPTAAPTSMAIVDALTL
jgi:hypothetical protein